jgi:hypothetical protein
MKNTGSREEALRIVEKFNSLPIERRVEVFRELSSQAREELVETVANPSEIVRRISEEEMYFTIKQLGEDYAPALISLTTSRQLKYILDVELWKKDMFDVRSAARWLQVLASAGEDKILHFVQASDPELVVTAMKPFMRVCAIDPDVDLLEQHDYLPPFTMDDTFFVEFPVPEVEEALKSLMDVVFRWNYHFYVGLMEQLVHGAAPYEEDMALKWRKARLADKGFPDFDEALQIYQYLRSDSLCRSIPDSEEQPPSDEIELPLLLAYPLTVIDADTLLRRSLAELQDPQERDRVSMELAHMANKVVVADSRDPGSAEELYGSLQKVSGYINIALEEMCGDDVFAAVNVLRANHMELLFRRGFSLILDLRKHAQKLIRDYEGGVENLGYPLAGLVNGLLQKRPNYASPRTGEKNSTEFQHLDEIEDIRRMMDRTAVEEHWEPI